MTAPRRAAAILDPPRKKCRRPTAARTRSARWRPPWMPAAPRWWRRLVHHRLEAVVGGHRGQRGVVGRGDGAVHGRLRTTALRRHHWSALLERPVVSELCSAAMLLPCADGGRVVAGRRSVHCHPLLERTGSEQGQLSCCDVRAVSHLSVVQDLRDVAGDRSFKHVFLGVVVTIWYRWSIALSQRALTGSSWHSGRSEM